MFCGLKVFLVIADRGADEGSESRAEGEGEKVAGCSRGGAGPRRRSFVTRW